MQDEKNNIKVSNKSKKYHIVDNIFKTLKFYNIKGNFTAKEIIYKNHSIKKIEANEITGRFCAFKNDIPLEEMNIGMGDIFIKMAR